MEALAILGVLGLFGNTIAVVVQATLNAHYSKISQKVTESTHRMVNNQRTQMLRLVASLSDRIARENPSDVAANIVAIQTAQDAQHASDIEATT